MIHFVRITFVFLFISSALCNSSDEVIKTINFKKPAWKAGIKSSQNNMTHLKTKSGFLGIHRNPDHEIETKNHKIEKTLIPERFDSRDQWAYCRDVIDNIRDQGVCGSCWAFATVEVMSDRLCIQTEGAIKFEFSPNDVLSCCPICGLGCEGGYPSSVWEFLYWGGIVSGGDFDTARVRGCQPYDEVAFDDFFLPECTDSCTNPNYQISYYEDKRYGYENSYYTVSQNVEQIQMEIMTNGPVVASYEVYEDFGYYEEGHPSSDCNHEDYVPSVRMGYGTKRVVSETPRRGRKKREIPTDYDESRDDESLDVENNEVSVLMELKLNNKSTQTEIEFISLPEQNKKLEAQIIKMKTEIDCLTKRIKEITLHEDIMTDSLSKYFTGIPYIDELRNIFELVKPYTRPYKNIKCNSKLESFTCFMITLSKLRFNIPFRYLAHQYGVSPPTIMTMFYDMVEVMYFRLKCFIQWPLRDVLQTTMPQCFKEKFGNSVVVIVDCFELFVEKCSNLEGQACTWSNYKHHNTLKFLIGITPQGTISYISDGYGGRISDTKLTEDCGILKHLIPGDVVLADRGFLIKDAVEMVMAKVITPVFLKGKKQLSVQEVEKTRKVSSVRIHVERVIGSLRQKYTILHGTVPISLARKKKDHYSVVNQIVTVCAALINLCPSMVSTD